MRQKLTAIHIKHYQGDEWLPQAGDFFTTLRADLALFQISKIDGRQVFVVSVDDGNQESAYDLGNFTSGGTGSLRVHVPKFVLDTK